MSKWMDSREAAALPDGSVIAKLDNVVAIQDYEPNEPCVRLQGVSEEDFEASAFNESRAEIFLFDLSLSDVKRHLPKRDLRFILDYCPWLCDEDIVDDLFGGGLASILSDPNVWIRIEYRKSTQSTTSYGYCLFREQTVPTYVEVVGIEIFRADQTVSSPPEIPLELPPTSGRRDGNPLLQTFDVGQGMCSLISSEGLGILMDCGAGTPIKRPDYHKGLVVNDLPAAVANLESLVAVISHGDSDHWRLLEWDAAIAGRVEIVVVPLGVSILAFNSPAWTGRVVAVGDCSFPLGAGFNLDLLRTKPSKPDANGEALVAHLYADGVNALLPGDYVYERFGSDGNTKINALSGLSYDVVVVPHHGCRKSAVHVPAAKVPGRSMAFVSAGDHGGYEHPRQVSLEAHSANNFRVINDKTACNVLSTTLLP